MALLSGDALSSLSVFPLSRVSSCYCKLQILCWNVSHFFLLELHPWTFREGRTAMLMQLQVFSYLRPLRV